MKKIFIYFSLLLLFLSSCSSGKTSEIEYIPFRSEEGGKWGMIAPNGEVLFENEFENCPSLVRNGRFIVENSKGKYEIYTAEKKPKQVGEEYKKIGVFREDVTPAVKDDEVVKLIDRDGKIVATLDKINGQRVRAVSEFYDGISIVQLENTFGCINKKGELVVEAKYASLDFAGDGKLIAIENKYKNDDNPKIDILSVSGKLLFSFKKDKYYQIGKGGSDPEFTFCEGVAPFKTSEDSGWGLLNDKGEVVLKPNKKIQCIVDISNGHFIYKNEDWESGVMTFDGETVIRAKYGVLYFASENTLWAGDKKEKYKLIDLKENTIYENSNNGAGDICGFPFHKGYAFTLVSKHELAIINESGNEISTKADIRELGGGRHEVDFMYSSWVNHADEHTFINNDHFYIEDIVDITEITKEGLGGWSKNMTSKECVELGLRKNENYEEPSPAKYYNYNDYSDVLSVEECEIDYKGVKCTFNVFQNGNLVERKLVRDNYYYGHYEYYWTNATPWYITVTYSGEKLAKNKKLLYNKLLEKLTQIGKIGQKSQRGAIVTTGEIGYFRLNDREDYIYLEYFNANIDEMPSHYREV